MATVDEMVIKWSMDSKGFNDGLTQMNKSMNVLKSEFAATSSKLKIFGSETDQLKNKQTYLNNALDIQKSKVDVLKKAYDKQVQASGENSKEAQNLAIKLNNQISYYNKLRAELEDTNKELKSQTSIASSVSKSFEKIGGSVKNLGSKLSGLGSTLSTKVTAPLTGLFAIATKGTEEFRLDFSKLEANVESAGLSVEKTSEQLSYLSAITGETDSSIEALSNMLSSGLTDNQMQQAVENLSGAVIKFPDTLKIESLADSMQETLATGSATGQYAELLERLGLNLDDFNAGLQEATANGTQQQYVIDTLANQGLAELNAKYKETNSEQIKSAEAQQNLQQKFSELGTKLTPILTKLTEFGTKVLDAFLKLDEGTQDNIIKFGLFAAAAGPVVSTIGKFTDGIGSAFDGVSKLSGGFTKLKESTLLSNIATKAATGAQKALNFVLNLNPFTKIVLAITAVIGGLVLLYNKCEWFRNVVNAIWEGIKTAFNAVWEWIKVQWQSGIDRMKLIIEGFKIVWETICNTIKSVWDGICYGINAAINGVKAVWEGVCNFFGSAWNSVCSGIGAVFTGIKNTVIGIAQGMVNTVIRAINWCIGALNKLSFKVPKWVPGIGGEKFGFNISKISEVNWLYKGGIIENPTVLGGIGVGDAYKGMGSNAEAVIPLDSMYANLRNIVKQENSNNQPIYVVVNVDNNMDSKAISKALTTQVKKEITRDTRNYTRAKGGLGIV